MITDLNKALRGGVFGLPWFFATAPPRKLHDVKQYIIEGFDIPHVCAEVEKLIPQGKKGELGKAKLSLYLASQLVYGLALILERKFMILEVDAQLVYESFIRISCFDELRVPLTSSRTKNRKRKSKTDLHELKINFDESFFQAVDLPLPNTDFAMADMDLITLQETSHKRSLLLDSFEHRNTLDLFGEQTCFQTQVNQDKEHFTNLPISAKQLMNDEISLFLPPSMGSSTARKTSIGGASKVGNFKTNESVMSGEIIEISTSEKHIYSNESLDNELLLKIPSLRHDRSPELTQLNLAVIKPIPETPRRRSLESLEFELDALKYPVVKPSVGNTRKRKLLRDDVMQLTYTQLREQMEDFSDTVSRRPIHKEKKYPTIEELFSIEPYWYPKNCIQRSLFRSCISAHCKQTDQEFPVDLSSQKTSRIDLGREKSRFESPFSQEKSRFETQFSQSPVARHGYCYLRETPERDFLKSPPSNFINGDHTINQFGLPGNFPMNEFNDSSRFNSKELPENTQSQQFSHFGSKANRSAKERISIAVTETVQTVLLSQIFPVKYTTRKTAAAAFQSVLELLKEGSLVVEQFTPYGEISLRSNL